ncbi:MAG: hypothetical protein R3A52_05270 [Polyangiales bacterium]
MSLLVTSLALSLAGLAVGPALVALGRGRALPSAAIEGFTLGVVPTILALRLVPHVVEGVGAVTGILLVLAGYALLWGADRKLHRGGARVGAQVVVPALALHALSDGAGLAVATASSGAGFRPGLVAALLLHRLPEGLFMTSALLPIFGWRGTALRLGAVGAATVIGAVGGRLLLTHVPDAFLDAVVALAAGAILRLVLHSHSPPPTTVRGRALSGAAFLFGAALVVWVPDPDSVLLRSQAAELNAADALTALFVECAPAVLVGVALLALLRRVAPTTGHGLFASTLRGLREPEGLHGMLREGLPVAALGAWAAARVALDPVSLTLGARLMGMALRRGRGRGGGGGRRGPRARAAQGAPRAREHGRDPRPRPPPSPPPRRRRERRPGRDGRGARPARHLGAAAVARLRGRGGARGGPRPLAPRAALRPVGRAPGRARGGCVRAGSSRRCPSRRCWCTRACRWARRSRGCWWPGAPGP